MSDLELLFLVLTAVYFLECAWWVPRGCVAFRRWFGRAYQSVHPSSTLGNQRGGFVFTNPLPPLGSFLGASQLPVSLSAEGVLSFVASSVNPGSRPPQRGQWIGWETITDVRADERKVKINRQVFFKAASPGVARHLADKLRELSKTPEGKRSGAIEGIVRATFDTRAIADRLQLLERGGRSLRLMTNGLFCYVFVIAPLLIWHFGIVPTWAGVAAGLYVWTVATAIVFRRAHKSLYPRAEDERFSQALQIALWPVTATRAVDLLSRPLLETFHPVAVAAMVCSPGAFRSLARGVLLEVDHPAWPLCPSGEPLAVAAEKSGRLILKKQLEEFLKKHELETKDLLLPPQRSEEACRSYCPRCRSQFTTGQGVCEDCGGLPLVPFEAAPPSQDEPVPARRN
jgi:hypothetical protein